MHKFGLLSVPIFLRVSFITRILLLCVLSMTPVSLLKAQTSLTIYFHKPEINTARNSVLKNTFDLYLSENGAYQFQPVDNRKIFETLFESEDEAVFMMSSRHYQQLLLRQKSNQNYEKLPYGQQSQVLTKVGLLGMKSGSGTYRKILVGKAKHINFSTMTLATSATRDYSISLLENEFSGLSLKASSALNVLVVPKDIDALMAVGFGLADMALTTKSSLEKLSSLYSHQNQPLHILGESNPLQRLAVVFRQRSVESYIKTLTIIKQMSKSEQGRRGLNMLGLDDWRLIDESIGQEGGMSHGK